MLKRQKLLNIYIFLIYRWSLLMKEQESLRVRVSTRLDLDLTDVGLDYLKMSALIRLCEQDDFNASGLNIDLQTSSDCPLFLSVDIFLFTFVMSAVFLRV